MQQTETGNFWWWPGGLLAEVQGNEKEATRCCCNTHYSIDERCLHQGIQEYTSARDAKNISWSKHSTHLSYIAKY